MAKTCPVCNLKHRNSAVKCVSCGAELQATKADKVKRNILIISAVSLLLVVSIIFAVVYFTGPKAKFRSIMRDFKQGDLDGVTDAFPKFFLYSYEENKAYFSMDLPNTVSDLSEYSFSCKIDKISNPSVSDVNGLRMHLDEYKKYGYNPDKLEDVKVVIFTMKGVSPGQWGVGFNKFILLKYDGEWYWWPFGY